MTHNKPSLKQLITVPATAFGQIEMAYSDCQGYQLDSLSDEERTRVPTLNPDHFFSADVYRKLALWWRAADREPLYMSGPAGSGKTTTALQFCARLHLPVVSVMARARMDRRELLGHWSVVDGNTHWVDGPAALAWRYGWVLLINEFSAAPADLWVSCNDLLEGAVLDCEATGERIVPHPQTRVIITDNTRGHADIEDGFFGRQVQDRSVIDRFWHLRVEGLTEAQEEALLLKEMPAHLLNDFAPAALKTMTHALAHAAADSRTRANGNTLGFETKNIAISHRALRRLMLILLERAAEPVTDSTNDVREAIRMAYTEALDPVSQEAIETLLLLSVGAANMALRDSRDSLASTRLHTPSLRRAEAHRALRANAPFAEKSGMALNGALDSLAAGIDSSEDVLL